jgi:hypothetical protein
VVLVSLGVSLDANYDVGAFKLFWDDMKKPIDERHIHRLITIEDGEFSIFKSSFTFVIFFQGVSL